MNGVPGVGGFHAVWGGIAPGGDSFRPQFGGGEDKAYDFMILRWDPTLLGCGAALTLPRESTREVLTMLGSSSVESPLSQKRYMNP